MCGAPDDRVLERELRRVTTAELHGDRMGAVRGHRNGAAYGRGVLVGADVARPARGLRAHDAALVGDRAAGSGGGDLVDRCAPAPEPHRLRRTAVGGELAELRISADRVRARRVGEAEVVAAVGDQPRAVAGRVGGRDRVLLGERRGRVDVQPGAAARITEHPVDPRAAIAGATGAQVPATAREIVGHGRAGDGDRPGLRLVDATAAAAGPATATLAAGAADSAAETSDRAVSAVTRRVGRDRGVEHRSGADAVAPDAGPEAPAAAVAARRAVGALPTVTAGAAIAGQVAGDRRGRDGQRVERAGDAAASPGDGAVAAGAVHWCPIRRHRRRRRCRCGSRTPSRRRA